MMNLSKIDWCDFTWNPVTGCTKGCDYCYARRQATRFSGDVRLNKSSEQIKSYSDKTTSGIKVYELEKPFRNERGTIVPFPVGFEPTLHEYRLGMPAQKSKPAVIFVCSMGDLFSPAVPTEWIKKVFAACEAAPQHTYLFLTKFPRQYEILIHLGILPKGKNFWFGTSIPHSDCEFFICEGYNTFVSIEPILERFPRKNEAETPHIAWGLKYIDWVIIGAQTGNNKRKIVPEREWIEGLVEDLHEIKTPVFMKDSAELKAVWGEKLIKEFPKGIQLMQPEKVPHCKECKHCKSLQQGKRGWQRFCKEAWEYVPGKYTRTSPPWCPLREKRTEPPRVHFDTE